MKRKNSSKNKSGKKGLKKLSTEALMAIDMMVAGQDNGDSREGKETYEVKGESAKRKETEATNKPLKHKRMSPDAELLRWKASSSNGRSVNFLE